MLTKYLFMKFLLQRLIFKKIKSILTADITWQEKYCFGVFFGHNCSIFSTSITQSKNK